MFITFIILIMFSFISIPCHLLASSIQPVKISFYSYFCVLICRWKRFSLIYFSVPNNRRSTTLYACMSHFSSFLATYSPRNLVEILDIIITMVLNNSYQLKIVMNLLFFVNLPVSGFLCPIIFNFISFYDFTYNYF